MFIQLVSSAVVEAFLHRHFTKSISMHNLRQSPTQKLHASFFKFEEFVRRNLHTNIMFNHIISLNTPATPPLALFGEMNFL